jgi:hypothetical protein
MNSSRYQDTLLKIPSPGCGCHPSLLGVANLAVKAGLDSEQIFQDIRQNIPQGDRRVSDREIQDAINKALSDYNGGTFIPKPRPKPIVNDGKTALQRIIEQGKYSDEADIWEASPIRLRETPQDDPDILLKTLYKPNDFIFMGERYEAGIMGQTIRPAAGWITHYQNGGKKAPHLILNPLNGMPATTKNGDGETLRGDKNVKEYRYCLVEFDALNREDQIRFWSAVKLPIVALIDSGGKSIHAWLEVSKLDEVNTSDQWGTEIKGRLYDRILTPMGVDGACSNPARLSRLPGHYREEKGSYQRLLWLSPEGKPIC